MDMALVQDLVGLEVLVGREVLGGREGLEVRKGLGVRISLSRLIGAGVRVPAAGPPPPSRMIDRRDSRCRDC